VFHGSIFRSFYLFGGRWIEDAISQRSARGLDGRQDLLPTAAGVVAAGVCLSCIEGIDFGLDLRAEFVGSAPEFIQEARDLATDLGHFLGAEKNQRQKKQEDHLAGEAEIHTPIIMRDGGSGPLASWTDNKFTKSRHLQSHAAELLHPVKRTSGLTGSPVRSAGQPGAAVPT